MTYRIGEEVVIAAPSTTFVQQFAGWHGTVTKFVAEEPYPYEVQLDGWSLGFAASELASAELLNALDESLEELWAEALEPDVDEVNHPSHYTWLPKGIEVINITELMNFNLGNVVKYVLRAGHKTEEPITDLRKAAWYINREIERLEASK